MGPGYRRRGSRAMTMTVEGPNGASIDFPDGTDKATIHAVMTKHFGQSGATAPSTPWSSVGAQMLQNTPASAFNTIVKPFIHPIDTAKGMYNAGAGLLDMANAATDAAIEPYVPKGMQSGLPEATFSERYQHGLKQQGGHEAYPEAMAQQYGERFGSLEGFKKALATDPIGMLADVSLPLTLGGGLAARAPGIVGKVGDIARKAGEFANPVAIPAKVAASSAGKAVGSAADALIFRGAKAALRPGQEAVRQIGEAFQKDEGKGLSRQELDEAQARGQPVTPLDMGSRATQRLAKLGSNFSPEAQEAFDKTLGSRYRTQNTRMADWIKSTFHYPDRFAQQDAIDMVEKTVNRMNYAKAHANPASKAMWDEGFEQLMQAPVMQQAAKSATSTGANRSALKGFTPVQRPFEFHDTDSLTPRYSQRVDDQGRRVLPNLEFWDNVKRNLSDKEETLLRAGEKSAAMDVRSLRTELVRHLDALVPEYASARGGAAQLFGAENALEAGKNAALDVKKDNREISRDMAKFSPVERKLFEDGFVDQFIETIQGTKDRANILDHINATPKARERFNMVVGPQRAKEVESFLRVEEHMQRANKLITGRSDTARQTGDMKLSAMDLFDVKGAMVKLLRAGAKAAGRGIDEKVAVKVAEMLTSKDLNEFNRAINIISKNKTLLNAVRNAGRQPGVATGALAARNISDATEQRPN